MRPSTAGGWWRRAPRRGSSTGGSVPTTGGTSRSARPRCASTWLTGCRWCRPRCGSRVATRCSACTARPPVTWVKSRSSRSATSHPRRSSSRSSCAVPRAWISMVRPSTPTAGVRSARRVHRRGGLRASTAPPRRRSRTGTQPTGRSHTGRTAPRGSWGRSCTRWRTAPRCAPSSASGPRGSARPSRGHCPTPTPSRAGGGPSSTAGSASNCPTSSCNARSRPRASPPCWRARRGGSSRRWRRCSRTGGSTPRPRSRGDA